MTKYLIEYVISFDNKKPIGQDDVFEGDGVFYIEAKNKKEAKSKSLKKIKRRFKFLKINFERIEES